MKCFNCNTEKSRCYYSPKELTKYNIYFCSECIKLLQGLDLRYIDGSNNHNYAERELKLTLKGRNNIWNN